MTRHFDVAIIGSGFSGSILAWILASRGRRVALIDPALHPRFAIGESSTPIADLLLRRLGQTYGLTAMEHLSTYGSWQRFYPQLACGRKRGFSYYVHEAGKPFRDSPEHDRSLLVAASADDEVADTHWYRRDVDDFFFHHATAAGAETYAGHWLHEFRPGEQSRLTLSPSRVITADWVIDASGPAGVTARLLNQNNLVSRLITNTRSIFGHYRGVRSWGDMLRESGFDCRDDPFHTDDAAQHHLHADGWIWMLRFNNEITSVGWTSSTSAPTAETICRYPSIQSLLGAAQFVEPAGGPTTTGRLQRLFHPQVARRCLMLPTAACTIDPLHSTGIAHALSGVQRVAAIVLDGHSVQEYAASVLQEARLLDRLVSTAYRTLHDFRRFTAACMLYFAAAITCEERILAGETPTHLWNADEDRFVKVVDSCCQLLLESNSTAWAIDQVRRAIQPWNTAGLMDPAVHNRYAYTATKK